HEKAGEQHSDQTHPSGPKNSDEQKKYVDYGECPQHLVWTEAFHQVARGKSADSESRKRSGKQKACQSFRDMRVVLGILDEITPCANLCAHITKLSYHG